MTKETKMKIFSLESKVNMVVWSVVFGVALNLIASLLVFELSSNGAIFQSCLVVPEPGVCHYVSNQVIDIPFQVTINDMGTGEYKLIIDVLIWILISFIILFATRHFRKKNNQVTSNPT